jgi:NADH-quinone oxidoreductase subunit N
LNYWLIAPEISLGIFALIVIVLDLLVKRKGILPLACIAGLMVALGFTVALWGKEPQAIFNNTFNSDHYALFFKVIFIGAAFLVILSSIDYVNKFQRFQGEYYALILLSAVGMMFLAATGELISIYISLELTSLSLYALTAFLRDAKSAEAGLKYLLLGAVASAVLLFGMALVYGFTGTTHLSEIAKYLSGNYTSAGPDVLWDQPGLLLGIIMMIAGFGFKIAAVPFQMWVPDVYEGAPTPVTAYLSVASKAAGFAVILRVFFVAFGTPDWLSSNWAMVFAVISAFTMSLGNVMALFQNNIKRMMGYSSIAQAGYLMVGLAAVGMASLDDDLGRSGVLFFLASYAATNLGAFIAIIAISNKINSDLIDDYSGMSRRSPLLALGLALCLFSLIGIPPAAGFIAKVYIFNSGVQNGLLWLVLIGVINSVVSAFYYLRVVKVMYLGEPASQEKVAASVPLGAALALAVMGMLYIGIFPGKLLDLAKAATSMFS